MKLMAHMLLLLADRFRAQQQSAGHHQVATIES
jgi:hypothetical protein